ncbi:hypothetical protein G7046_g4526 [Stylonectria norvegica]|nr:hypothetical protein G7046_g4526 [Stylonectria norvegica]
MDEPGAGEAGPSRLPGGSLSRFDEVGGPAVVFSCLLEKSYAAGQGMAEATGLHLLSTRGIEVQIDEICRLHKKTLEGGIISQQRATQGWYRRFKYSRLTWATALFHSAVVYGNMGSAVESCCDRRLTALLVTGARRGMGDDDDETVAGVSIRGSMATMWEVDERDVAKRRLAWREEEASGGGDIIVAV